MVFSISDFNPAMAEIVLAIGICVVLLVDLFVADRWRDFTYLIALVTLALTAWVCGTVGAEGREITFSGSFVVDPLARILKLFAIAVMATVFLYSRVYLRERQIHKGEYYLLGLFALMGIMVMISA